MNWALPPAVTFLFSHCLGSDLSPPASLMNLSGRICKMHVETYLFLTVMVMIKSGNLKCISLSRHYPAMVGGSPTYLPQSVKVSLEQW